jgi:UDP-2,4-diacetamido-2,4,6-trideoxy-beta-L-altropyranose hydrolase
LVKPRILVRADGNVQMGLGHVIRSSALAQMLQEAFTLEFVCREIAPEVQTMLEGLGFTVHRIDREIEFLDRIEPSDLVVLDGYRFDLGYQLHTRSKCAGIICIDDLLKTECHADVIINQSPGAREVAYKALPHTRFALGLDYVLLRPAFLKAAREHRDTQVDLRSLFVCFGGSDAPNLTLSTWRKALESGRFDRIVLVTGASYEHEKELRETISGRIETELHHDISADTMLELMRSCGVKIVPASGILFEVLTTGGIVLCGYYTENQIPNHSHVVRTGAVIDVGIFSPTDIEFGFTSIDQFRPSKPLIDGKSPERFVQLFSDLYTRSVSAP